MKQKSQDNTFWQGVAALAFVAVLLLIAGPIFSVPNDSLHGAAPEQPSLCGNGIIDPGEECDDGNQINGDGCSGMCKVENPVTMTCKVPRR